MARNTSLADYRRKRNFDRTSEPESFRSTKDENAFVVHKHGARRLHYDLRLQIGDFLKCWAVTKGPSLDTSERRLAVQVEDHPIDYASFEGVIPKGEYGAGPVIIWDRGTWVPMGDPIKSLQQGQLKFRLAGNKLRGGWALVRLPDQDKTSNQNWLLIKEKDTESSRDDILTARPESIESGKLLEDLVTQPADKKRVLPKRINPKSLKEARQDPSMDFVRPQLASISARAPSSDKWIHEIKFDGYRTLVALEKKEVRFLTRSGLDWTERYGVLSEPFGDISCKSALIDGEVVVQDKSGVSDFGALQDALRQGDTWRLLFYAFDLLYLDGWDLRMVSLLDRKRTLAALIALNSDDKSALQYSEHIVGQGQKFFEQSAALPIEGIVSKRSDSTYRSGKSRTWLKTKHLNHDEFIIVGFTESKATGGLGAMLLAEKSAGVLQYVGKVGSGFGAQESRQLISRFEAIRTKMFEVIGQPKSRDIRWVKPTMTAEVEYLTRTRSGKLRHPVYRGLRQDKGVHLEKRPQAKYVSDADLASIWVTNPNRVMFGRGGPTKLDLALYYARVGDWMLPELVKRPLSLFRCPSGAKEDCFYQRHVVSGMPSEIRRIRLTEEGKRKRSDYIYLDNAPGLLGLSQFGVVEFHPWGCRVSKIEKPDRMIFDLDPDEDLRWRDVVRAAYEIREKLADLGLKTFVKTTGGKGLHIVVPIIRRHSWREVHEFSKAFVVSMSDRDPSRYTASMSKKLRSGRIFIDFYRNARGSTAVAAYSLRAAANAPVSTPLSWDELSEVDDPKVFNYVTIPRRLAELPEDPWAELEHSAKVLTVEMKRRLTS